MAFPAEILRSGVAIANTLTAGVQSNIIHEAWIDQDVHGIAAFAAPVTLKAVIDLTRKKKKLADGRVITVVATLTIVGDVAPNGAANRYEPIDPRDVITLPDGTTGPIVLEGPRSVMDPTTGRGFIHEIMISA